MEKQHSLQRKPKSQLKGKQHKEVLDGNFRSENTIAIIETSMDGILAEWKGKKNKSMRYK